MFNYRKPSLIVAVAAATATAAAVAVTASGQAGPASTAARATISVTQRGGAFTFVDAAPKQGMRKPPSQGDAFIIEGRLSGDTSGADNLVCTVTRPGRNGLSTCVGTLVLPAGTISIQGVSRLAGNADTFAITGGTGRYAAATGTVASAQGRNDTEKLTIQIG